MARVMVAFPGIRAARVGFMRNETSGFDILVDDSGNGLVDDLGNFITL